MGHAQADVWNMTPRQINGYIQLAHRRLISEHATELAITALGSQGEGKNINKQIEEWERES